MKPLTADELRRICQHFLCELWGRKTMRVFLDPTRRTIRVRGVGTRYNWPVPKACRQVGGEWAYPSSVMKFRAALKRAVREVACLPQ